MRVTDDRYSRDLRRYDLAVRLIRHEARTQTIRQWTGLTDDRIRKLYRSYVRAGAGHGGGEGVRRHRGKSPRQVTFFARSRTLQLDTACLAAVFSMFGVLPPQRVADASRTLPGLVRGELLCDAYETYRRIAPQPQISFEHAAFLALALAAGAEIRLQNCRACNGLGPGDPLALRATECLSCGASTQPAPRAASAAQHAARRRGGTAAPASLA